jgi:hypothetical protein
LIIRPAVTAQYPPMDVKLSIRGGVLKAGHRSPWIETSASFDPLSPTAPVANAVATMS